MNSPAAGFGLVAAAARKDSHVDPLAGIPKADTPQSAKDFKTDQEVRWCPGCGDYAVLAAVQSFLPELELRRENIVFVSGIGCSSRFPYYMNTYGMHSIHGRAPTIATGLAISRPDLSVWVVTGDGDALSIGGNHLIHALRRNVNLKILLFNNRIYGLTKGQYSPTSEQGKVTKSTPLGSLDIPFNPVSLALGAEASFVARTIDSDRKHLTSVLRAAAHHRGTALVEIYQNCNIFNDGAFELLKSPDTRDDALIRLEHGEPVRFGAEGQHGVARMADGTLRVVDAAEHGTKRLLVHDAHAPNPEVAFALSRLADPTSLRTTAIGVYRDVHRATYDDLLHEQIAAATDEQGAGDREALAGLLAGNDTWTVTA
jgi:2-oxoglutarate/2-oxoacid ferredoxin oxidoreductase subunit beta